MSGPQYSFRAKVSVPTLNGGTICRDALVRQIIDSAAPLTIVQAGAGYGKTTALSSLQADCPGKFAWLTLDEWDRDTAVLVDYLGCAVAGQKLNAGEESHSRVALSRIASAMASAPGGTWLALDDFHVLDGAREALGLVDYLVRHLPQNCRIFIASRSTPQLPSRPRLTAHGAVHVVQTPDLAFSDDDVRRVWAAAGNPHDEREVSRIHAATDGWPVMVRLLANSSSRGDSDAARSVVFDYLLSELFEKLPDEHKELLLSTCVLESFDVRLASCLSPPADFERNVDALIQNGVPLTRTSDEHTQFRVHPVVRECLQTKLRRERPDRWRDLCTRAARWYRSQGQAGEAIHLFAAAQRFEEAAALITRSAEQAWSSGHWHAMLSWLAALPMEEKWRRPELAIWEARVALRMAMPPRAEAAMAGVVKDLADPIIDVWIDAIHVAILRDHGEATQASRLTRPLLKRAKALNVSPELSFFVLGQIGDTYFWAGDYRKSLRYGRLLLESAYSMGEQWRILYASLRYSSSLLLAGRLTEAFGLLQNMLAILRKTGSIFDLPWALCNIGCCHHLLGRDEQALSTLQEAAAIALEIGNIEVHCYSLCSIGEIYSDLGELNRAERFFCDSLQVLESEPNVDAPFLKDQCLLGLAGVERQRGNLSRGLTLAETSLARAISRRNKWEEATARRALGQLACAQGDSENAIQQLEGAAAFFERAGAMADLFPTLLELAEVCSQILRERARLNRALERAARCARNLSIEGVVLRAVVRAPAAVRYAVARNIAPGFYRKLLSASGASCPGAAETTASSALPAISVKALGQFEVRMNGRPVLDIEWKTNKAKELLLLLLDSPAGRSRDEVIACIWPDAQAARGIDSFHSTVYRLRGATCKRIVLCEGGAYRIDPEISLEYDVDRFRTLARSISIDHAQDAGAVVELLDSYAPFTSLVDNEWADNLRAELDNEFLRLCESMASRAQESGNFDTAIRLARCILSLDPLHEAALATLLGSLTGLGDRDAARREHRRYGAILRRELTPVPDKALIG